MEAKKTAQPQLSQLRSYEQIVSSLPMEGLICGYGELGGKKDVGVDLERCGAA